MRTFIPLVHAVELLVALVNHQDRAFCSGFKLGARDDNSNFNDAVNIGVESGHFAVKPNEVLVRFGKQSRHRGNVR